MAVLGVGIAGLTVFGVFILPFFFPPSHPSLSASYTAGFNNRAAAVATVFASLATFAVAWRLKPFLRKSTQECSGQIPLWHLAICIALCIVFTAGLGWMLCKAELASVDNRYFLEYMDDVTNYHLRIYSGFSFLYGPLLLYIPTWIWTLLHPFHVGMQASYFVTLTIAETLGLVLLYFTLEALPISGKIKSLILGLFTLLTMCPVLGMNYTLIRFLAPFSTLLFAARTKKPLSLAIALLLGELLQLSISPELGVAFAAGACFYAVCLTAKQGPRFIPAVIAPILAAAAFLAMTGQRYLDSVQKFSHGDFNLIVEPLGYILLFLLATVWLVPLMLVRMFQEKRPDAILMAGLFVVCLGLVPPALGRCDPLHVFFNGAGIILLASIAISSYSTAARNLWFICLGCSLLWMQLVNFFMRPDLRHAPRLIYFHSAPTDSINIQELETIIGKGKVSVPFLVPYRLENDLKASGHFVPDRECFDLVVTNPEAEEARADRMDRIEWALIPATDHLKSETPQNTSAVLGIGYEFYPVRQRPYVYGAILTKHLQMNWTPVAILGNWILFHHNSA